MNNNKKIIKISDENLLMIVLAFMFFSIGIWGNYRQLWLQSENFSVIQISRILSIALVCSSIVAFITSIFSTKIKIKSVMLLSIFLRTLAMIALLFSRDVFVIKTGMLLSIMCEVIFMIAFYPLLTFVTKTDASYRKKTLIEYFAKDIGVVGCGLLMGVSLGRYIFNYDTCLYISLVSTMLSGLFLLVYNHKEVHKDINIFSSLKKLLSSRINNIFLFNQLIINISSAIVYDLIMIILTSYIGFDVAVTSVFIISCNVLGSVFNAIVGKFDHKLSKICIAFMKYGFRGLLYIVAFLINKSPIFIAAIVVGYVTGRILENKVTGSFLQIIDKDSQFLYGNIRYFIACLGEGIGAFLAGVLLGISFKVLFLGAGIFTLLQTFILIYLGKYKDYSG